VVVLRDLYKSGRALVKRKLGACPKCMARSIAGSGLSWLAVAILYAMWPNRVALAFGLMAAVAFTVLTIAHVVVHMFRAAPIMRRLPVNRRGGIGQQKSRREFALAVARSGFSFAAAALLSVPLLPRRAEAGAAKTYALYCLGAGCANQSAGGLSVQCWAQGLRYGSEVSVACGRTAPVSIVCTNGGCSLTLELINGTCGPATATILSLKGWSCSPV
jgi:hypothetical protein